MWSASSSRTRAASSPSQPVRAAMSRAGGASRRARSPRPEAGVLEERPPLLLGVRAHVGRVAEPLGLPPPASLVVERVLDDDQAPRDARHLADGGADVVEVVRRDAAGDDVEAVVGERASPRRGRSRPASSPAPGRTRSRSTPASRSRRATCPPPVATSSACRRAGCPLDEQVEVDALALLDRRAVRPPRVRPDVGHGRQRAPLRGGRRRASSAPRAGWAGAASWSSRRPSSAFVPSSRTTIGSSIVDPLERLQDARAPPRRSA